MNGSKGHRQRKLTSQAPENTKPSERPLGVSAIDLRAALLLRAAAASGPGSGGGPRGGICSLALVSSLPVLPVRLLPTPPSPLLIRKPSSPRPSRRLFRHHDAGPSVSPQPVRPPPPSAGARVRSEPLPSPVPRSAARSARHLGLLKVDRAQPLAAFQEPGRRGRVHSTITLRTIFDYCDSLSQILSEDGAKKCRRDENTEGEGKRGRRGRWVQRRG
jgi:hypothetical protein